MCFMILSLSTKVVCFHFKTWCSFFLARKMHYVEKNRSNYQPAVQLLFCTRSYNRKGKDIFITVARLSVFVCVLAALRAYLRKGDRHLQQTPRGWRSPASSDGVSGLRHTSTRYGAKVDAWISAWKYVWSDRGTCAFSKSLELLVSGARECGVDFWGVFRREVKTFSMTQQSTAVWGKPAFPENLN